MAKLSDWTEEIQDYIAASTDIDYTVDTDLFVGRVFEVEDITTAPSLVLYEENSEYRFGRIDIQTCVLRFVFRAKKPQDSLSRAQAFFEWLRDKNVIATTSFTTRLQRVFQMPNVITPGMSGIYPTDLIISFIVTTSF